MIRLGIIPAAGKAERFGRIYKELLADKKGKTLLENAVEQLGFCESAVVITSDHKLAAQKYLCRDSEYRYQKYSDGLHGAIMTGARIAADAYFIVMPDTVFSPYPVDMFGDKLDDESVDLFLGYFYTMTPSRFGVNIGGKWVDKPDIKDGFAYFRAWGFLGFSHRIKMKFAEMEIHEFINWCYDENRKIAEAKMTSYHDMATIDDYRNYLCS